MFNSLRPYSLPLTLVIASGFLSACAVTPEPFQKNEIAQINRQDREKAVRDMAPLTAPLTLEEAIARALKYNLEHRTRMVEQAFAVGQLDASRYDMLPKLMANAGYSWRNEDLTREAVDSVTGQPSLSNPFISSERQHNTTDITFSWSLLDFGASYYTAKQNADRVLIASERRRKAMHTLVQNVRTAYWRAVAAEMLGAQVKATIEEAETALEAARTVSAERVKSPAESLRYQRNLLENLRLLENVDRELSNARIELANHIGLLPGTPFQIAIPEDFNPQPIEIPAERMEELALSNNADLREQFYNVRVAASETRKAILRLLPGISLDYGNKYDNDKYLVNDQWREAGIRVGFNLLNVLALPSQMKAGEMGVQVAETRRMALQMSVLTQVHLARFQYNDALLQYRRANAIYTVDNELARLALNQEQSQMASRLDRIAANVTAILSSVRRYHAIAKVNEASSKIQATLGLEPQVASVDDTPLEELAGQIGVSLDSWVDEAAQPAETPAPSEEIARAEVKERLRLMVSRQDDGLAVLSLSRTLSNPQQGQA